MKHLETALTEEERNLKKTKTSVESKIDDIKARIDRLNNGLPDDPKSALAVKKQISDLNGQILTLKMSIPKKPEADKSGETKANVLTAAVLRIK